MPDAPKQTATGQFLPPPPRRYRVRIAIDADDLHGLQSALALIAAKLDAENPVVHGFNGGGNYSAALALNPFAPRGVEHAQASRAWVENMPTEQRAGLERTRGRANSVAKVEGGPSGLAALPGLVEVTISAGTQGPVPPVAVPMPEPASVPESVADAVDLESSQPAPRVLTPDPVVLQLPVNEHAPTGGAI